MRILNEPRVLGTRLPGQPRNKPFLIAPRKHVLAWGRQREQRYRAAVVGDVCAELPLERKPPTRRRRPLPPTRHRPLAARTRPSVVAGSVRSRGLIERVSHFPQSDCNGSEGRCRRDMLIGLSLWRALDLRRGENLVVPRLL